VLPGRERAEDQVAVRRHLDGDRDEFDRGIANHRDRIAVARARAERSRRGIRTGLTRRRDGDELEPGERPDGGHVRVLRPAALRARPDDADPDRLRHATMLLRRCGAGPAPIGYGRRHRLHRGHDLRERLAKVQQRLVVRPGVPHRDEREPDRRFRADRSRRPIAPPRALTYY